MFFLKLLCVYSFVVRIACICKFICYNPIQYLIFKIKLFFNVSMGTNKVLIELKGELAAVRDELEKLNLMLNKLIESNGSGGNENEDIRVAVNKYEIGSDKKEGDAIGKECNEKGTDDVVAKKDEEEEVEEIELKNGNDEIKNDKEENDTILSKLAGFVSKVLRESKPKDRLSKEEALKLLQEMGFEDIELNKEVLEKSSSFQEAICTLLDKH